MARDVWLDELTRALARATSRRAGVKGAVATVAAALTALAAPGFAPSKKGKGRNKKKGKKGKGGPPPTGSCGFEQTPGGNALHVVASGTFNGKPLTLDHRTMLPAAGDPSSRTRIELGGQLVIQYDVDRPPTAASRLRVQYGLGFSGVKEATYIIILDAVGGSMGGTIDGRALIPRALPAVQQDPGGWQFADGGSPPVQIIDPNQLPAVQAILDRSRLEVARCGGAQAQSVLATSLAWPVLLGSIGARDRFGHEASAEGKKKRRKRNLHRRGVDRVQSEDTTVCDEVSDECLTCWASCGLTLAGCCLLSFFGCGGCYAAYNACESACDSQVCCSVKCGSDIPTSCCCDGEQCCEGNCCKKGEVCWPGGVCCKEGRDFCKGDCCPQDTFCKEGICCRENAEPCLGKCCPPGETCREEGLCCPPEVVDCDGKCCENANDACQGTVCCPPGQIVCAGACCPAESICKPKDGASEEQVCCPPDLVCGPVCCDELSRCIDAEHATCCPFAHQVCGGVCCPDSGDVCLGRICCPGARVCGETCCPAGNFCADPATADCRPCGEGEIPCDFSVAGAPDCCPQNTQCCGDGTCCDQGVPCCDQGDGPRCNPNCIS
jgi:hypothetical protein